MSPNPQTTPRRALAVIFATLALLAGLAAAPAAPAQSPAMPNVTGSSRLRPDFKFSATDFVTPRVPEIRTTYFLGEPVRVPVYVSNHTQYPVTLRTNMTPRGQLRVTIRREGDRERPFYGPYAPGLYTPLEYKLYPLEELRKEVLIWSDLQSPNGLALPQPGVYHIKMTLEIGVVENEFHGKMDLAPLTVTVVPPPAELTALVDGLIRDRAFADLEMKRLPEPWKASLDSWLDPQKTPICAITPYIQYVAATYYANEARNRGASITPETKPLVDAALRFYQIAAQSDFAYRVDTYMDLLRIADYLGLTRAAEMTAATLVSNLPSELRGKIGNHELLKKYTLNSAEYDPERYWEVLN